ncbi:MAG: ATP-binding cassette domain-containing protein, partial [Chthoniobacteraceae bacterium]
MPAVEARALTKVYRTYKKKPGLAGAVRGLFRREYAETRAVEDVSFSLEEGEFVGFLGPNGAGKTTALKILSGLLNPTGGEARVLGFVPWERKDAMKRQISLLMGQKNALWWDLPARESLELNRAIYGIAEADFHRIVDELTTLLDVADKLDVMVRELSLGERMKFELISALLHSPRVLFLDEPTIGLDVTSQLKVRDFLRRYNAERRITTMLTSHYMDDIEALCHRVIVIDAGRIMFDGPLSAIVARFATHKIIGLTFTTAPECDFAAAGEIVERTDSMVKLRVPRARVTEVARDLLASCDVHDISVEDAPVEDVIRQLFAAQAHGAPASSSAQGVRYRPSGARSRQRFSVIRAFASAIRAFG